MINITDMPTERLAGLKGVLTDVDDTLSTRGRLTAGAYSALWRLHEAGLKVVLVTGRPAGWCDHLARFWPVDAVVGENGGFYFFHDGAKLRRRFLYNDEERAEFRRRLTSVGERIFAEVPGCALASDQAYREYDLAIDFCEDVEPLKREEVVRIKNIFEQEGAHAKISSIHVNGWFGDFDKLSTTRLCMNDLFGIDIDVNPMTIAFCGDSPNDEPMFAHFPLSFGMANVLEFTELMTHPPAFVTMEPCGAGFEEVAARVLAARGSGQPR